MRFLIITLAILASACSRFSEEAAIFVAHNRSNDPVIVIVDGKEVLQLGANSTANFEVGVQVARRRVGDSYGPSQVDKQVQVTIAFKNLRTGRLSRDASCTAGAKVKTNVFYDTQFASEGYASCSTSYTY